MTIEITKGSENPVAEFFSSPSNTPETDEVSSYEGNWDTKALRMTYHARRLERERDEARNELLEQARLLGMSSEREAKLISERDEALEEAEYYRERYEELKDQTK
jgi:hypothetical protein